MTSKHKKGCMCDACIQARTREKVLERETTGAKERYERIRGAPIGSISVADALKQRSKKKR